LVRLQSGSIDNLEHATDIKNRCILMTVAHKKIQVLPDGKRTKKVPTLRIFCFGRIYINQSGTGFWFPS
jgi:hypothetical protein